MAADYPLLPKWQAIEDRRNLDRRATDLEVRADTRKVGQFQLGFVSSTESRSTSTAFTHVFQNFSPFLIDHDDIAPLTTERLLLTALELPAGEVISGIQYIVPTKATGVTRRWGCLANAHESVAFSATYTDTPSSGQSAEFYEFTTPYTVPSSGMYFAGICYKATTMPEFYGRRPNGGAMGFSLQNLYTDGVDPKPSSFSLDSYTFYVTGEVPHVSAITAD